MENLKKLREIYAGLSSRGKSIVLIVGCVVALGLVELFTGCSAVELGHTWSF